MTVSCTDVPVYLLIPLYVLKDMDLCCLIDSNERLAASDLVTMLGDLLERGLHILQICFLWFC